MRLRMAACALVLLVAVQATALEVPQLEGRVNDRAGLFTSTAVAAMESDLKTIEDETGAQVVVLTVPSLEGESLEVFSMDVVETWRLGQEDRDNGVLILIARDDRKIRIEVGYGLEGVLPDVLCGRIIDNAMKPSFRQGDFSGGTQRAVELIAGLVKGDPDASTALTATSGSAPDAVSLVTAGFIFFAVVGVFAFAALFSKGFAGWFLYLFLMPFFFAFPAAALGLKWGSVILLVWAIGFPILRVLVWHTTAGKDFRGSHSTWTTTWPSGGSLGGGGGFSGGGFSGGGGSFGGGGASGGW